MFPFTAVIFGGGVILLDYINKIAPYPLIGLVSHFILRRHCSTISHMIYIHEIWENLSKIMHPLKSGTAGPPSENVKRIKDEIFHIPAAERYCQSNYSYWDPKITTPPGLYIYSSLIAKAVGLFVNVECDTITLRVGVKNEPFNPNRPLYIYIFNQLEKSNKYPAFATSIRPA